MLLKFLKNSNYIANQSCFANSIFLSKSNKNFSASKSLNSLSAYNFSSSYQDQINSLKKFRNEKREKIISQAIKSQTQIIENLYKISNGISESLTDILSMEMENSSNTNLLHEKINCIQKLIETQENFLISPVKESRVVPKQEKNSQISEANILAIFQLALSVSFYEGILETKIFNFAAEKTEREKNKNFTESENALSLFQKKTKVLDLDNFKICQEDKFADLAEMLNAKQRTEFCYIGPAIRFGLIVEAKVDDEEYQFPALSQESLFDELLDRVIKRILVLGVHCNSESNRIEIWYKLVDKDNRKILEGISR